MSIYFTNINIYNTSYSNQILTNFHIKRKSLPRKGGVGVGGGGMVCGQLNHPFIKFAPQVFCTRTEM